MTGDRTSPGYVAYAAFTATFVVAACITVAFVTWDIVIEENANDGYPGGYLPVWSWLVALVAAFGRALTGAGRLPRWAGVRTALVLGVTAVPVALILFVLAADGDIS